MEEHALKGEYISVLRNGVLSYGGSQRWLDSGAPIPPWSGGIRPLPTGGASASLLCTILDVRAK